MSITAKDPLDDPNSPLWDRLALMYAYLEETQDDMEAEGFAERFAAWRLALRKRMSDGS